MQQMSIVTGLSFLQFTRVKVFIIFPMIGIMVSFWIDYG